MKHAALRRTGWILGVSALLALGIGWAAGPLICAQINKGLADMKEGYVGHVEAVSVDWLVPGVTLHELRVERPKHKVGVPFLTVERLEVEVLFRSWHEPRIGLRFVGPVVSFVDAPRRIDQQWGPPFTLANLREKLPFDLGYAQLTDMQLHFRNFHSKPPVDSYLQKVSLTASPLDRCIQVDSRGCKAQVDLDATLMATGKLRAHATLLDDGRFSVRADAHVRRVQLPQLNPVLIRYAEVDIQKGRLDLDLTAQLTGAHYRLTLLPDFDELSVLGGQAEHTNKGRKLLLALIAGVVERRDEDWRIVIEGDRGRDNLDWKLKPRSEKAQKAVLAP